MPADTLTYRFVSGPAHSIRGVGRGGEIDLTEQEVIDLSQRKFVLEPVDRRRKLPDGAHGPLEQEDTPADDPA